MSDEIPTVVRQTVWVIFHFQCLVAHTAGAYPGFGNIKRLGVFLLFPRWDVSPSQGYSLALHLQVTIYTSRWREAL